MFLCFFCGKFDLKNNYFLYLMKYKFNIAMSALLTPLLIWDIGAVLIYYYSTIIVLIYYWLVLIILNDWIIKS